MNSIAHVFLIFRQCTVSVYLTNTTCTTTTDLKDPPRIALIHPELVYTHTDNELTVPQPALPPNNTHSIMYTAFRDTGTSLITHSITSVIEHTRTCKHK